MDLKEMSLDYNKEPNYVSTGTVYFASDSLYAVGKAPLSGFYTTASAVAGGIGTTGVVQIASKASACTATVNLSGGDGNISYP